MRNTRSVEGILTDPSPVQVDGHERRRNGEVVDEGVELQHEPKLVTGSNELKNKREIKKNKLMNVKFCHIDTN